jgi:hypothetical protein
MVESWWLVVGLWFVGGAFSWWEKVTGLQGLFLAEWTWCEESLEGREEKKRLEDRQVHPMRVRYEMLGRFRQGAGLAAVGLALVAGQGCKKKQAPAAVQPVVHAAPRPAPVDFPDDPPDPVNVDQPVHHSARRIAPAPVMPAPKPVVDPNAAAEAQRQRDASLLQQQQAASQRQQQELNGVVQRSYKLQQEQQAEPRIQDLPEVPITQPVVPGQEPPRIQDNPNVQQQQAPTEEPAPSEENPAQQQMPQS